LLSKFQKNRRKKFKLLSLNQFPHLKTIREDGKTFEENAIKKAMGYAKKTGLPTLAEDSGLCVDALGGKPGIYSARFSGAQKSDVANCKKVLTLLRPMRKLEQRKAHFYCAVAICMPDRIVGVVSGRVTGRIAFQMLGSSGFGYDPILYYPGFKRTFGQVSPSRKNKVSHRFRALKKSIYLLDQFNR